MGLLFCVCDHAFFNKFYNTVGEHLGMDTEILFLCKEEKNGIRDRTDSKL